MTWSLRIGRVFLNLLNKYLCSIIRRLTSKIGFGHKVLRRRDYVVTWSSRAFSVKVRTLIRYNLPKKVYS